MIFFPALTLDRAPGLVEIPSICCEWYFNPGLSFGRVLRLLISRLVSAPVKPISFTSQRPAFLSKGRPLFLGGVQVGDVPSKHKKESGLHPASLRMVFEFTGE